MNILGDFLNRVNTLYPAEIDNEELNGLLTTIRNQGDEIEMRTNDISNLQAKVEKLELEGDKLRALLEKKAPAKKSATPKTTAKKPAKKAPAKKAASPVKEETKAK
jgi:alpha-amylase